MYEVLLNGDYVPFASNPNADNPDITVDGAVMSINSEGGFLTEVDDEATVEILLSEIPLYECSMDQSDIHNILVLCEKSNSRFLSLKLILSFLLVA